MKIFRRLLLLALALSPVLLAAQAPRETVTSTEYLKRAETMYHAVWSNFRTHEHELFTEHFPSANPVKLDYFQGESVDVQEVSFLWPFSGLFSATNTLLLRPELKDDYLPFLDSLSAGMEMYKDTTRSPAAYQAYPSKFKIVDRYYDDNGLVAIDYMESYFNTKNPVYL